MQINKFLKSSPIYTSYFLSEKVFNPLQKRLKSEDLTFIQSMILAALYFEKIIKFIQAISLKALAVRDQI